MMKMVKNQKRENRLPSLHSLREYKKFVRSVAITEVVSVVYPCIFVRVRMPREHGHGVGFGVARCIFTDVWDETFGVDMAFGRATKGIAKDMRARRVAIPV